MERINPLFRHRESPFRLPGAEWTRPHTGRQQVARAQRRFSPAWYAWQNVEKLHKLKHPSLRHLWKEAA